MTNDVIKIYKSMLKIDHIMLHSKNSDPQFQ
jgi:hypothetical protein